MRVGNKIYEPFPFECKSYPNRIVITEEMLHEVHEVHEKCTDCNMYVENGSQCKGIKEWDDDKCLKVQIHKKMDFTVGGGEQKDRLRIVM